MTQRFRRDPQSHAASTPPSLRGVADQVTKEDGKSISPQYLFDIEEHHRVPHVLRELARVLDLDYDKLLARGRG